MWATRPNPTRVPISAMVRTPQALFVQMSRSIGDLRYSNCATAMFRDPPYRLKRLNGPINGPNFANNARPRRHKRPELEATTDIAMDVQSQHRRAAATAHGVPQPPPKPWTQIRSLAASISDKSSRVISFLLAYRTGTMNDRILASHGRV